jgi:hypothetical protein
MKSTKKQNLTVILHERGFKKEQLVVYNTWEAFKAVLDYQEKRSMDKVMCAPKHGYVFDGDKLIARVCYNGDIVYTNFLD